MQWLLAWEIRRCGFHEFDAFGNVDFKIQMAAIFGGGEKFRFMPLP